MGVGKGDKVAVMALNSMEYVEIYYAGAKLGAVFVPLNYRAKQEELAYMFNNSETKVLFVGERYLDLADKIKPDLETVEHIVCIDGRPEGMPNLRRPPRAARARGDLHRRRRQRPDDRHLHQRHDRAAQGRRAHLPRHVRLRHEHRRAGRPGRRRSRRAARLGAVLPRRRRHHDALVRLGRPQDGDPAAVRSGRVARGCAGRTASPTASSCRRCSSASWSTPTSRRPTSAR